MTQKANASFNLSSIRTVAIETYFSLSPSLFLSRSGSDQLLPWPIDSIDQRPTATASQQLPGARFTVAALADNLTFVGPQVSASHL